MTYNFIFIFLIITRVVSEIVTIFLWSGANYIWASLALIAMTVLTVLYLLSLGSEVHEERSLLSKYFPIFLYLLYLLVRLRFYDTYSYKCFFSEVIVWWIFIFTTENAFRDPWARKNIELWLIRFIKFVILVGIVQILVCCLSEGSYDPLTIVGLRPVTGIFAHANIYLIITLPFVFYFLKNRTYFWIPLIIVGCVFTGTRAPFLALACIFNIIIKSLLRKKVGWPDVTVSLLTIVVVYALLFKSFTPGETKFLYEKSRLSASTLQWRIDFWQNFVAAGYDFPTFFGHGVGAADEYSAVLVDEPLFYPHSDYIRIYYDTGIVGLLLFFNVIFFMLRKIISITTTDNVFVVILYLLLICFYITDNFIYNTHSIFLYMFMAIFLMGVNKNVVLNESTAGK